MRGLILAWVILSARDAGAACTTAGATWAITSTSDVCPAAGCACGVTDGVCTLRAAIVAPGKCPLHLTLPDGVYALTDPLPTGARQLFITGGEATRIQGASLSVPLYGSLQLRRVTLRNAPLIASGDVTLSRVVVEANEAGTAITMSKGMLQVEESIVANNAIASLVIEKDASATIARTTFMQNGGITARGAFDMRRSTLSQTGIEFAAGVHTLRQSTLWGAGLTTQPGAQVSLHANVLQREGGTVCDQPARFVSEGNNVISDTSCQLAPDWQNKTQVLAAIAHNGGFSPTHLLLSTAPGVDAFACEDSDQRGYPPVGKCDVGAFERTPVTLVLALTQSADSINEGSPLVYRWAVENRDLVTASELEVTIKLSTGSPLKAEVPAFLDAGQRIEGVVKVTPNAGTLTATATVTALEGSSAAPVVLTAQVVKSAQRSAEEETLIQDELPEEESTPEVTALVIAPKRGCQQLPASNVWPGLFLYLLLRFRQGTKLYVDHPDR